jgi:D-tyrosyl-tRNA(Tyr) deacylase
MRAIVQRVTRASVTIEDEAPRSIGAGLVVLLGVGPDDTVGDADYLASKIAGLRIFGDEAGKMNLSVKEIAEGACLIVSQFTLYGDCRRGKRPSFTSAAPPDVAIPLYEHFVRQMRDTHGVPVKTGEFGAHMAVELANDGPVTLMLDSKQLF